MAFSKTIWGGWYAILITCILRDSNLQYTNFLRLFLGSVIVSTVKSVHTSGKQGESKAVPVFKRLLYSLGP